MSTPTPTNPMDATIMDIGKVVHLVVMKTHNPGVHMKASGFLMGISEFPGHNGMSRRLHIGSEEFPVDSNDTLYFLDIPRINQ